MTYDLEIKDNRKDKCYPRKKLQLEIETNGFCLYNGEHGDGTRKLVIDASLLQENGNISIVRKSYDGYEKITNKITGRESEEYRVRYCLVD